MMSMHDNSDVTTKHVLLYLAFIPVSILIWVLLPVEVRLLLGGF